MVLVEIGAGSLIRENYDSEQNFILQRRRLDFLEEKWRRLDFLEEKQCNSQLLVAAYPCCTARYFNSKVKPRRFQVGDLVLRKVLHNKGALDLGLEGPFKIVEVLTQGEYKLSLLGGEQILRLWNVDHLNLYYQWLYDPVLIKIKFLSIQSDEV